MPGTPNTSNTPLSQGILFNKVGIGKYQASQPITLSTIGNAVQFHIFPGHKGRLTAYRFIVDTPASTAGRTAVLTPSIAGVNTTGGVLTLTTANCNTRNNEVVATTITGTNLFTDSQVLTFTGSGVTAFAEGTGVLWMELVNDDTAEVLAAANEGLRNP